VSLAAVNDDGSRTTGSEPWGNCVPVTGAEVGVGSAAASLPLPLLPHAATGTVASATVRIRAADHADLAVLADISDVADLTRWNSCMDPPLLDARRPLERPCSHLHRGR
jgi:hypothetical protein